MNLVLRGSAVESCTPTFVCVSWGRADNRPWVGRPYLRRRPISPITGWKSSGGALFFGNQISARSGLSPAVLARVEGAALLLFQFASASGKINEAWVKFSRTTLQ